MMRGELSGRCLCGRIRWRAPGPALWAGHCHCESCRRATSAPVTSFFGVPQNSVTWNGELSLYPSSPGAERGFCGHCGSQMFFRSERWPEEIHLYAASLDDPTLFEPKAHYHYAERVPWLNVVDDLPKHDGSADA